MQKQEDYWCSEEHKTLWQKKTYGKTRSNEYGKPILSIEDMQKRLLEMGKEEGERDLLKNGKQAGLELFPDNYYMNH